MTVMNTTASRGNVYRAPCRTAADSFDEAKVKEMRPKEPRYPTHKTSPSKNHHTSAVRVSGASEERTVRAVIPTTHLGKVEIPESAIEPTAGKAKYTSTNGVGQDFSVCVKHMKGECSMGQNCRQLHVAPAWFKSTDFERRSKMTCCGACGEYNCTPDFRHALEGVNVQFTADGNAKLGGPVAGAQLGNTKGLRERLAKAAGKRLVTIPVREVCRLHQNDECHFGNDCTRIHICRQLAASLSLPPVPRKNKVFAEEPRGRAKKENNDKEQITSAPQSPSPPFPSAAEAPAALPEPVREYTPSPTHINSSPTSPRDDIWAIREDDSWGDDIEPAIPVPQPLNKLRNFAPAALLPSCINDLSLLSEECTSPLSCVRKCIREVLGPCTPTVSAVSMGFWRS